MTIPSARADYPGTVLGLNPVAYYRLNETTPVPDDAAINSGSLGAAVNGLYVGAATHPVPGALVGSSDTAASIPGSGHIIIPWNATMNLPGAFTVECWANTGGAGTETLVLSMIQGQNPANGNDRSGWCLRESGTDVQFVIGTTTVAPFYYYFSAVGAVNPGAWQHVVGVYDGTSFSVYVDGVEATLTVTRQDTGAVLTPAEIAAVRVLTNFAGPTIIGERGYGGWNLNGSIDEVAIYTNALSAGQILARYQNGTNASPSTPYSQLVLNDHPVAYYRLDEPVFTPVLPTAVNSGILGAAADGTYQVGTASMAAGPPYGGMGAGNYGCLFSGIAGYIDCGNPSDLDAYSGPISIMTWIKVNAWDKSWEAMVTKGDSSWRLHRNSAGTDTRFVGFGTTGLSNVDQAGTRAVDDGFWHHVVAVYDGSAKYIYVDGTLDVSTPVTGTLATDTYAIYIGENAQATGRQFAGTMDEVAIFTNGLSAAQVLQVYNSAQVPPIVTQVQRTPADPLYEGYNITMTAAAIGSLPMTNKWYKNTTLLTGKTNLTFSITNAAVGDSGNYTLVVANAYGSSTSAVQVLTVSSGPPLFLSQIITNATRAIGGRVTYSVVAGGSAPVSYRWNHNSTPIPGATNSVLMLRNLQIEDQGAYTVTLSNPYGTNNNSATGVVSVVTVTNFPFAGMYGNPLAYYRLNETSGTTAFDIADGLNGTLNGPIVTGVPGPQPPTWEGFESTNTAFQFDGAAARVQLPPFNLQTNQMTIVAWINPAGPQSDQTGIVSTRNGNDIGGLFLNHPPKNTDALGYVWYGNGSWNDFASGLVPVVGQWNFVALVIDPQKGTIYLDSGSGLQSSSFLATNQTVVWSNPNIGVDPGYDRFFNGSIDEVIVYDRSLSPAELANLDLLGTAGPVAPRIQQQPASQAAYARQSAAFNVAALGALPLGYQWHHAGTNLPGATSPNLTIPSVAYTDAGNYDVVITNGIGSSNSITAALTVLAPPTFANLTNGLVLHLKFDGNYLDSSGRTNNATPVGSPSLVPGKLGHAMHFNTDNSNAGNVIYNYATLGSPADLQFGTSQNFSVSYWIRFTGTSVDLPVLSNDDCGEGCIGFYFGPSANAPGYTPNTWAWSFANSSYVGIDAEGPANAINDGQWHHFVSTFDRTGLGMTYLDGVLVDARPVSTFTDTLDSANPVNVGQVGTGNYGVVFGADVDDLGVWLRELSPTEAQSIYMVGQQGRSFDTYGPVILSLRKAGNDLELVWQTGTLLSSTTGVNGTYNPVPGATAPYYRFTPGPTPTFYRVKY